MEFMKMFRTIVSLSVVALIATAVLVAYRGTTSTTASAGAEACPCGQCDVGCTCCTDPDVDCGDCQCESCRCEACATTLVADSSAAWCSTTAACCADGEKTCCADGESACCADKAAESDEAATLTTTDDTAAACPCGQCEVGCTCCSSDDVSCEDCQCESCGCEACATES